MTLPVNVFTFVADETVLITVGVSKKLFDFFLCELTVDVGQHKPQFLS